MREDLSFSVVSVAGLFIWYVIIFFVGGGLLLKNLISTDALSGEATLRASLTCAAGAALVSSSLFYVRKLYKDVFANSYNKRASANGLMAVATIIYFVSRPLFAILFAIMTVLTAATFIHATTVNETKLSIGFVLVTVLISAYGAAATGTFIKRFERVAIEKLKNFGGPT
ncbi:MAG TPA: hypothetical protein VIJ46_00695 [Rhabdochlamydiaceae bacterium]